MPPLSRRIQSAFAAVAGEKHLGASIISQRAAEVLLLYAEEEGDRSPDDFLQGLAQLAEELIASQPDMAPLLSLARTILNAVQKGLSTGSQTAELAATTIAEAGRFLERIKTAQEAIGRQGGTLIEEGEVLLTHSYSASVKRLLEAVHRSGKDFQLLATESLPGLEGKLLVQDLRRGGIDAQLIADKAVSEALSGCQKVLVGADRMMEGHFVNKVGTRAIALEAKRRGIPFIVVCDRTKWVPPELSPFSKRQHALQPSSFPNIIVKNAYFEVVPLSLVSFVLSEEGPMRPEEVKRILMTSSSVV